MHIEEWKHVVKLRNDSLVVEASFIEADDSTCVYMLLFHDRIYDSFFSSYDSRAVFVVVAVNVNFLPILLFLLRFFLNA